MASLRSALLALLLVAAPLTARASEPHWETWDTQEGIALQQRAVEGSSFEEHRASFEVAMPPGAALDALWKGLTEHAGSLVTKREVLRRTADEIVVYDQMHTPVVSDRDMVMRLRHTASEVRFEALEEGRPPAEGYVRLTRVRGAWSAEVTPTGTRLTYTCFSEPGGSVPAFLVRSSVRDQTLKAVLLGRKRVLAAR